MDGFASLFSYEDCEDIRPKKKKGFMFTMLSLAYLNGTFNVSVTAFFHILACLWNWAPGNQLGT